MERVLRATRTLSVTGVFCAVCLPLAAEPIPLEGFASEPQVSSPAISPDGARLVFISSLQGRRTVIVRELATSALKGVMNATSGDFTARSCWYKNDKRVLCSFRGTDHFAGQPFPVSRLVAVNADGSGLRVLIQNGSRAGGSQFQDTIVHELPNDPNHVLIALREDSSVYPSVFRLNVESGGLRRVQVARPPVTLWMADRNGVVRFGYGHRDREALYIARDSDDAPWRTLEKFKRFDHSFSPLGFGVHPSTLLVTASHNDRTAIFELDLEDRTERQLVFAHPEADVEQDITWPDGSIVGFEYATDRPQTFFINPRAESVQQALDRLLPQRFNRVIGGSRDATKLIVMSYSDVKPIEYYLADLAAGKLSLIGEENPQLRDAALSPMKSIVVPGPGGVQIPGYLTVPVGKQPHKLPAVVYPHGGPHTRDHWGYDPVVQMMASRGYVVLQLNFRGSTGYGYEWYEAGRHELGTVMHDDITAGARWLISEGIADPARMCIVGWSYGGYAALIGVTKEPELYRCAVSIAGVSDLFQLQRDDDLFYGGRDAVRDVTGIARAELDAVSPRRNAERIKVPVLLVHGDDDIQVLVDHSKSMSKALKRAGVPNELVILEGGDHSLTRGEWRGTLLAKMEAFLAAHIGGAPARTPDAAKGRQ